MFSTTYPEIWLQHQTVLIVLEEPLFIFGTELKAEADDGEIELFIILNWLYFEVSCLGLAIISVTNSFFTKMLNTINR